MIFRAAVFFGLVCAILPRIYFWFAEVQGPLPECAKSVHLVGKVNSVTVREGYGGQVSEIWDLTILRAKSCPALDGFRARISRYPDAADPLVVGKGASVAVVARLKRPWGSANPGGFNYRLWLLAEGYRATGYVQRILRSRGGVSNQADALSALSVGDTSGVKHTQWRVFRETGTLHLMVVSGLHVGIFAAVVGGVVFVFLTPFGVLMANRVVWQDVLLFSMFAVFAYAWLTGMQAPVVRAAASFSLFSACFVIRRKPGLLTCLGAIAAVSLLAMPEQSLMTGFWLSYGAVAVLIVGFQSRLRRPTWLAALILTQLFLFVGLSPVLGYVVGPVPLSSTIANILVVPFVSMLLIPGAMFIELLDRLWDMRWLTDVRDLLLFCFEVVVTLLTKFPDWRIGFLSFWRMFLGLCLFGFLCVPMHTLVKVGFVVLWLSLWISIPERLSPGEFRVTALDVGQGSAAIVDTREGRVVVDTGPRSGRDFNAGEAVVLPALQRLGARSPDLLFTTHVDLDHAGGLFALLEAHPGVAAVGPGMGCQHGRIWSYGGVRFRILRAPGTGSRNDRSCTLLVQGSSAAAYFAGDIGRQAELELKTALPGDINLLMAPHHGSNSSSHPALVKHLSPDWAVFSAGMENKYGHPHEKVVDRYSWVGARHLTTGEVGAVSWWSEHNVVRTSRRAGLGLDLPFVRQADQSP